MTLALPVGEVVAKLEQNLPDVFTETKENSLYIKPESLFRALAFLKTAPGLEFNYLAAITAVDYLDCFEVIYQLTSLVHNHSLVLKTRCDRANPTLPSVVSLWRGADFQEREIFDLMGIKFEGHPNLKRIVLWDGFPGHPLRKDFLEWN